MIGFENAGWIFIHPAKYTEAGDLNFRASRHTS